MAADFDAMAKVVPRINADNSIQSDAGLAGSAALIQAAISIGCGHVAEGQAILQDNPALLGRASGMIALRRDAALAGIETALGRPHGALRLLEPYEASPLADHVVVERARAYMALNDLRTARGCIRGVLTSSSSAPRRYTVIEALLCEAQIAEREDDEPRAVELLMQATDIANGDVVLPFARCADVFAKTLACHPTLATRWPSPPSSPSAATIRRPPNARGLPTAAHRTGASGAPLPLHEHVDSRDRLRAVPFGEHGQDPPCRHLPEAGGAANRARSGSTGPGARTPLTGRHPDAGQACHPHRMMKPRPSCEMLPRGIDRPKDVQWPLAMRSESPVPSMGPCLMPSPGSS